MATKADDGSRAQTSKVIEAALSDAGVRAKPYRQLGSHRIPLEKLGVWPGNRGKAVVQAHHLHEVAHDIMMQGRKPDRYGHAPNLQAERGSASSEDMVSGVVMEMWEF